jgi:hypothetical protein
MPEPSYIRILFQATSGGHEPDIEYFRVTFFALLCSLCRAILIEGFCMQVETDSYNVTHVFSSGVTVKHVRFWRWRSIICKAQLTRELSTS